MGLSRLQRHHRAACDQFKAGKQKPPTRKQAKAWLEPIRKAFREIQTGEVDSHRGYAITRIHWADEYFARVDHCINGFVALIKRLMPEFDVAALDRVSRKLTNGVLLTHEEVEACFAAINRCEDRLIEFKRSQLMDAALTEQVNIELERMGLKDAA
jgi:hypothetical protein